MQGTKAEFQQCGAVLETLRRYLSLQPAAKCFSAATRQPPGEPNAFPSLTTWPSQRLKCRSRNWDEKSWYVLLTVQLEHLQTKSHMFWPSCLGWTWAAFVCVCDSPCVSIEQLFRKNTFGHFMSFWQRCRHRSLIIVVNCTQWDHITHPLLVGMDGPKDTFKNQDVMLVWFRVKLEAQSAFCTKSALRSSFQQFLDRGKHGNRRSAPVPLEADLETGDHHFQHSSLDM
eukprot:s2443_g3.t1